MTITIGDLMFVGSEAEGYYGGAYECVGSFVSKAMYKKYEEAFKYAFDERNHGELDGKHSEVYGDLFVEEIDSEKDIPELVGVKEIEYGPHFTTESIEYDEDIISEEGFKELNGHLREVDELVENILTKYKVYMITLTEDQYEVVQDFVADLQKEER